MEMHISPLTDVPRITKTQFRFLHHIVVFITIALTLKGFVSKTLDDLWVAEEITLCWFSLPPLNLARDLTMDSPAQSNLVPHKGRCITSKPGKPLHECLLYKSHST